MFSQAGALGSCGVFAAAHRVLGKRALTRHGVEGQSIHPLCERSSFILGWSLNVDGAPPLSAGDDSTDTDSVMCGCSASYISMYLLPMSCHGADAVASQMDPLGLLQISLLTFSLSTLSCGTSSLATALILCAIFTSIDCLPLQCCNGWSLSPAALFHRAGCPLEQSCPHGWHFTFGRCGRSGSVHSRIHSL